MNDSLKKQKIKTRIETEEDFIYCPRLSNSIKNVLKAHPDGIDNERIAKIMLTTEQTVETLFQSAIKKIRNFLKIKV